MSRLESDAVSFQDASSCFSEEEWTRLQEWQKKLCGNLMKEIQQALISLGPLIATSVFSLKAKEKQMLYTKNSQESERHCVSASPGNLLEKAEARVPVSTNHLVEEVDVSISDPDSRHGAISFSVEDDDLAYCKDHDDSTRIEISARSTGILLQKSEERVPVVEEVDASIIDPDSKIPVITAVYSLSTKQEEEICLRKTPEPEKRNTDLLDPGSMISKDSSLCCESKMNFTHESSLNQCQIIVLEEESPFAECDARFIRNISLLHQETKETGAQSFPFDNCDKSFPHNAHVQYHQKIHIGENTYLCNECGKSFRRSTSLKRHQILHNGNNPFPCTECERSFVYKTDLDRHLRFHRGDKLITCNICGKTFMYRSHLQRHLIYHTGERPFPCTKCDKRFTQKINLLKHQKVHTGVSL